MHVTWFKRAGPGPVVFSSYTDPIAETEGDGDHDSDLRGSAGKGVLVLREFKEFAVRGNVVDMAVGIIIGGAFGTIAKSLVSDIVMPPIGLLLGGVHFQNIFAVLRHGTPSGPYQTLVAAQEAGAVTVNWGVFADNVLGFLIVAFVVFLLVKGINRLKRQQETGETPSPTSKACPFCISDIPLAATRCPRCTSRLESA